MNDSTVLAITGVICVTVLTAVAMFVSGHNGTILAAGCTAIGGIIGGVVGYTVKSVRK